MGENQQQTDIQDTKRILKNGEPRVFRSVRMMVKFLKRHF